MTNWQTARDARSERLGATAAFATGKIVEAHHATRLLEALIRPGDRVCLEGDNQKQADFLARALCKVDTAQIGRAHV